MMKQKFINGQIHNWYRMVHGYSDKLIAHLIDELKIEPGALVIDPFCGSGTTLVECKKRGISSIGIDANPSSFFASKVKTNWRLSRETLERYLPTIQKYSRKYLSSEAHEKDEIYHYFEKTGMIERGWFSKKPLIKILSLKYAIDKLNTNYAYKNLYTLCVISEAVQHASNVRFGPELYIGKRKNDCDVLSGFLNRVNNVGEDLQKVRILPKTSSTLIHGDSRKLPVSLKDLINGKRTFVITSPPYPGEHDYSRNSRIELVLLGKVFDRKSLQTIKKKLIRCTTKGIYKGDNDCEGLENLETLNKILVKLERKIIHKNHGFARLYPTVVKEYFGGMYKHLKSLNEIIPANTLCAYVVGDQSSFLQVHIPTAELLSDIASRAGFKTLKISHWRNRWSTTTSKGIEENILLLKKTKSVGV